MALEIEDHLNDRERDYDPDDYALENLDVWPELELDTCPVHGAAWTVDGTA